jgi:hypothetical protein
VLDGRLTWRAKSIPRVLLNVVVQLVLADERRALQRWHEIKVNALLRSHGDLAVGSVAAVQSIEEVADARFVFSDRLNDALLAAELELVAQGRQELDEHLCRDELLHGREVRHSAGEDVRDEGRVFQSEAVCNHATPGGCQYSGQAGVCLLIQYAPVVGANDDVFASQRFAELVEVIGV